MDYRLDAWIDDATPLAYSEYWSEESHDEDKAWNVRDEGGFEAMERHLATSGLEADLEHAIDRAEALLGKGLEGRGADLAAGTCWTARLLHAIPGVAHVTYLDYARHRIHGLAPLMLAHFGVPVAAVDLVWGSFYDLKFADGSLDFIVLATALHHADDPDRLLAEAARVLRRDGIVLVVGEHRVAVADWYLRNGVKSFLSVLPRRVQGTLFGRSFEPRKLFPSRAELLAPDAVLGDHYYATSDYRAMFHRAGFQFRDVSRNGAEWRSFVLTRL